MEPKERDEKKPPLEEQQLRLLKKQLWYSRISAGCVGILALVLVITALTLAPKANAILKDFQEISSQLKEEDLHEMVNNINELAESSQDGVAQATEKLNEIDLESLNQAIQDLSSVVSPLARFFGR